MKTLRKMGSIAIVTMLGIAASVQAEPTTFEWSSTTGFIFSSNQQAIEEITGQASFPVNTPAGQFWVVPGSMNGEFTYDPENSDPPLFFGPFAHYVGASINPSASLFNDSGLIGSLSGGDGRVIVADHGEIPGGPEDVVNVNQCCGTDFTVGAWQATGASVVWVGQGFQDGQALPVALPPAGAPLPLALFSFFNAGTGENVSILTRDVDVREAVQTVAIDVKPGSDPNCFNINGHGVIPVAILGSAELDVANIDQTSLSFGGLSVRVRGNKYPQCGAEYSNADEYLDLVCHFQDDSSAWVPGGDEATLSGILLDGTPIEGSDSICLVQ